VLERAFSVGVGGIVSADVRTALGDARPAFYTAVAGLGGRPVTEVALRKLLTEAVADRLEPLTFVDLNRPLVERELARAAKQKDSGPTAEHVLRDLRATAK
jgi:pyruvate ferredoxin oxidoreductase alpha subunit